MWIRTGDGTPDLSVVVGPGGSWSVTPAPALPNGTPVSVTATDPSGNTSAPVSVTTDSAPPAVPVVNPSNGGAISGTAEPGSLVNVDTNGDGTPDLSVIVGPGGSWSVTPAPALPNGTPVSVTATDPSGNTSAPVSVTTDSAPPAVPVVNPSNGGAISGTAEPGSLVNVDTNGDGTPDLSVVVGPGGSWSVTPAPALPNGTPVSVTATDPSGNTSAPVSVTTDSAPPAVPVVNPSNGGAISGTAEPGSLVNVDTNGDGTPDLSVVVGPGGSWSVTPAPALPNGTPVSVTATDPSGNTSAPVSVTTDSAPPAVPVVNPSNGGAISGTAEPGSLVNVDTNGDGTPDLSVVVGPGGSWSVTPAPALPNGTPVSVTATDPSGNTSAPVSVTTDSAPPAVPVVNPSNGGAISGTAEPGSLVNVDTNGDGTPDLSVVVGPGGSWSVTPAPALPNGTPVSVTATDPSGNTSAPVSVTTDSAPPAVPVVNPSNGGAISGTAEPGSLVNVDTNGDGTPDLSVVVGPGGSWSVTPAPALPNGTPVSVTATDPSGNTSAPVTVTTDATPPAVPVVNPSNGGAISGTAEPGSLVNVDTNGDGTPDLSVVVGPGGSWSVPGPTTTDRSGVPSPFVSTFTKDPGSAVPEIAPPFDGFTTGTAGAFASTTLVVGNDTVPPMSAVTEIVRPCGKGAENVTDQLPFASAVVV